MSELNESVEVAVSALSGAALDWAVAKAEGIEIDSSHGKELRINVICKGLQSPWLPSVNWYQGGPLIDKHAIGFWGYDADNWQASSTPENFTFTGIGPTHLIAACRLIVSAKFGKVVSVPKELIS